MPGESLRFVVRIPDQTSCKMSVADSATKQNATSDTALRNMALATSTDASKPHSDARPGT